MVYLTLTLVLCLFNLVEKARIKAVAVKIAHPVPWPELLQFMLTLRKSCTLHNSSRPLFFHVSFIPFPGKILVFEKEMDIFSLLSPSFNYFFPLHNKILVE